jgi:hypothetical protein
MSGDNYYHFPNKANKEVISPSWIRDIIQIGLLGAKHPNSEFIMEGIYSPQVFHLTWVQC